MHIYIDLINIVNYIFAAKVHIAEISYLTLKH